MLLSYRHDDSSEIRIVFWMWRTLSLPPRGAKTSYKSQYSLATRFSSPFCQCGIFFFVFARFVLLLLDKSAHSRYIVLRTDHRRVVTDWGGVIQSTKCRQTCLILNALVGHPWRNTLAQMETLLAFAWGTRWSSGGHVVQEKFDFNEFPFRVPFVSSSMAAIVDSILRKDLNPHCRGSHD